MSPARRGQIVSNPADTADRASLARFTKKVRSDVLPNLDIHLGNPDSYARSSGGPQPL